MVCRREIISLNPVKSRVCETPGLGKGTSKIGYIKLTSFNQNASGMVTTYCYWLMLTDIFHTPLNMYFLCTCYKFVRGRHFRIQDDAIFLIL